MGAKGEKWKFYYPIEYAYYAKLAFFKDGSILITNNATYQGSLFKDGYWQRLSRFKMSTDMLLPDTVNNIIWVIADSNKRLLKYDLVSNRYVDSVYFQDSLLHFSTLSVDKSGAIWFFSPYKYGLGYLKNKKFTKAEFITPGMDSILNDFVIGPDDKKYIITRSTAIPSNAKMLVVDGNSIKETKPLKFGPSSWLFDTKGNVYLPSGISRTIIRFNGNIMDTIALKYSYSIGKMAIDREGRIFYAGKKDTLYMMSDTGTAVFHVSNNTLLKEDYTLSLDNNGKVWIASSVGLGEWDKPMEEKYRKEYAGLGNEYCLTFAETGERQYLVSCFDRMTTINAEDKYNTIFYNNTGMKFEQILKDRNGDYWCSNRNEYVYKKSKSTYIPLEYNGSTITAYQIHIGRDGNLLILRKNDVLRYDGQRFQQIVAPFDIKTNYWNYFLKEDTKGRLWVCDLSNGMFIFDGGKWQEYSITTIGEDAKFYGAMDLDSNNHLWVTGYDGLYKWDEEKWQKFAIQDSLFLRNAEEMVFDQNGKLWITSYLHGVGYFDGSKMVKYTTQNSPLESNIGLHVKVASNNDKWFFLGFGIMVYNEEDDPIPPTIPMSETISFYPNPTNESITIQNLLSDDRIQLFDLTGRKLVDYKPGKEGDQVVSLDAISRGLYLLNIDRKNQAYFQAKVLKE